MGNYVVQETRRWDFKAKSMKEAKKKFEALRLANAGEVEERGIVEQETGNEESLLP